MNACAVSPRRGCRRFARLAPAGLALVLFNFCASPGAADRPRPCEVWSDQRGNPACTMPADVLEADRALNRAWRALLDARAGAPAEVALLRREQRDWLLRRDKTMRDALKDLYDERIAYVESLVQQRPAADPARREAVFGRYGERVRRCYVDGTCAGWGDSDVFILPTGKPGQARVLVDTLFFNGHSCTLDEVGTMEDGRLVVLLDSWDAARKAFVEKSCRVRIAFDPGRSLVIENPGGCDSSAYCGTRGSLYGRYPRWRAGTPARR